jgi:cleavage stimulation factor subunit 3
MMQNEDTDRAAKLFGKMLMQVPHVRFWSLYVDYIRRKNNVITDTSGAARQVINAAFKLTFEQIGQDPASLPMWQDYINYLKAMPGNVSGDGWQDKQKVDLMRKAYREALSIPLPNLVQLWGEYTSFELSASRVNVSIRCLCFYYSRFLTCDNASRINMQRR